MSEVTHTSLPWKAVQVLRFNVPGGLLYISVEPVEASDDTHKHLKMADGTYHVCRFSHTGDDRRAALHRADAEFIVRACNSHYEMLKALQDIASTDFCQESSWEYSEAVKDIARDAVAIAEGRSNG